MSDIIIKVEDLSKKYRLGTLSGSSLVSDVNRYIAKIRGKEDPYSIVGTNSHTSKAHSEFVWSLKDINFEIKQGDAVGIIGKNGAGKSTLLKILSRVTAPTTGSVKIKGRVASLLEVGTGFHPDLSGRDNIFMNGAILGMSRNEIKSKFDEIVDFAGVEKYIDTPVKRYSSGMYVRLAFAVAAHLESEILIVDEVLAVGDAEFQKRCLGKMKDISASHGRTVLFVSHNIASINVLCNKGILLQDGMLKSTGLITDVVQLYQKQFFKSTVDKTKNTFEENSDKDAQILSVEILSEGHERGIEYGVFDKIRFKIDIITRKELICHTPIFTLKKEGIELFTSFASDCDEDFFNKLAPGEYSFIFEIPIPLKRGIYSCDIRFSKLRVGDLDRIEDAILFEIVDEHLDLMNKSYSGDRAGLIPAIVDWKRL